MYAFLQSLGIANPTGSGWLAVMFTFGLAWAVTKYSIPPIRAFALKVGWADQPNARRLNKEPLPNAGGLAIYAGAIAAIILATVLRPIVIEPVLVQVLSILLGGSILVLVGFIDDQYGLSPYLRLFTQILTALLLYSSDIRIETAFETPLDPLFSLLLTVFWVVAITNAVNLMDGMDGLVGGISFITAMSLLAVSAQFEARAAATLILAALGGATLGFLRYNFYPSQIIMGDTGAYFFGYVLAATSIIGNLKITTVFAFVPTAFFLLLPLLDTTQVFVRRLLAGKNPMSSPGKDHLHHRLLALGFSQRHAALTLWGITLVSNALAMHFQGMTPLLIQITMIGIIGFLSFTVWRRVRAR